MKSVFEKLKDYFNNTSLAQIQKDWDATAKYDNVNSPTISEFMDCHSQYFEIEHSGPPDLGMENFAQLLKKPELYSGFSFLHIYGQSKFLNRKLLF